MVMQLNMILGIYHHPKSYNGRVGAVKRNRPSSGTWSVPLALHRPYIIYIFFYFMLRMHHHQLLLGNL